MPVAAQGAGDERYMLIPRTAIFVRDGESYLLIKGAPGKRLWAGKYNGIGGHVEPGEDVLTSARRELHEETGLDALLWLCGTVVVDAGERGIGLYVFTGEVTGGNLAASVEGAAEWISRDRISSLQTVEDVPQLIMRIHGMHRGDPPFSARSYYDAEGKLRLVFSE